MMTKLVKGASNHGQFIQSDLSDGHRAKFLPSVGGMTIIGYVLEAIWEMSVYTRKGRKISWLPPAQDRLNAGHPARGGRFRCRQ